MATPFLLSVLQTALDRARHNPVHLPSTNSSLLMELQMILRMHIYKPAAVRLPCAVPGTGAGDNLADGHSCTPPECLRNLIQPILGGERTKDALSPQANLLHRFAVRRTTLTPHEATRATSS